MISLTKKLLSVALAVVLLLGAFPATVLADGADDAAPAAAKTWTVKFYDADKTTVLKTVENVVDGETVAPPADGEVSIPAGKKIDRWECKNGAAFGGPVHGNCNVIPIFEDLPAEKVTKYTVSFDTNCELPNPASITVTEGGTYDNLPALKREGYTGVWTYGGTAVNNNTKVPSESHTLKADWTRNEYTVTFLKADGSVLHKETVRYGEKIANVPSLSEAGTRDGKHAYDWNTNVEAKVKSDLTIKPLFRANEYEITFNPNSSKLEKEYKTVTYGEKIGKMPVPTLTDYVFMGWYNGDTKYTKDTVYKVDHDITLTAKWAKEAIIELHIYRNGKTSSAYIEPKVHGVPVNTLFKLSNIDIADYYNASSSFKMEGFFDEEGWRAYRAGDPAQPITQIQTIDPKDGIVELYCMVTDTNAPKPTTKPADPSNPQTGDQSMILASTAAMLISAGALVMFIYDRKRRMA